MELVQVVRRFCPFGGMEGYVWQLAHHLVDQNFSVRIVCEQCESGASPNIQIDRLPEHRRGPRWYALSRFSNEVWNWRRRAKRRRMLVHAHEFIECADMLTFHTTVHGWGEAAWYKRLDPSWHFNQWIERRAVCSTQLRALVPVSNLLQNQLAQSYPDTHCELEPSITPGVEGELASESASGANRPKAIGFIGREWKRKGLQRVMDIFRNLKNTHEDLRLVIAGVPREEIAPLIEGMESEVDVLGWIQDRKRFYDKIHLLIHPARLEAFGMVITEAMAAGVRVLVSDQVGAKSEISRGQGEVLSLDGGIEKWAACSGSLLRQSDEKVPAYSRPWEVVAQDYQKLYQQIWKS